MPSFCISLTTIPSRFNVIHKTINSIKKQIRQPSKIFLNIPNKYKRFFSNEFEFSSLTNVIDDNLEISRCEDFGPGTKLLGSIKKYEGYDFVILIDDDHVYNSNMLDIFYQQYQNNQDNVYSFCVYNVEDCKVGQGADGFMINTKYLKNILNFYRQYVQNNEKLFFNDDLWISIYLNKILKKNIIDLSPLIKKSFFSQSRSIYKKHTTTDALIEIYSNNRKEARKLRFEENCKEYLLLKHRTNNFNNL
jgi:hypothetical protein